jgi:hypothetical protein
VIPWFYAYCVLCLLMYLLVVVVVSLFIAGIFPVETPEEPAMPPIIGGIYIVLGMVLAAAFALGLLAPRRKWGWIYNLVLICLTMTSCGCLPMAIPLLIFWIRADCRHWYGMQGA